MNLVKKKKIQFLTLRKPLVNLSIFLTQFFHVAWKRRKTGIFINLSQLFAHHYKFKNTRRYIFIFGDSDIFQKQF